MNATKPLFAALAAMSSLMALASAEIVGGVLTFDVEEGKSETYATTIDSSVTSIRKIGKGTMTVSGTSKDFKDKIVMIERGVLVYANKDALGSGNVIKVDDMAQLKFTFAGPGDYTGDGAKNRYEIEGAGPDGTGAIRFDLTGSRSCAFLGSTTLTGDATIGNYGQQCGFAKMNDLSTHTLTLVGSGSFVIGSNVSGSSDPSGFKNGHIVANSNCTGNPIVFQGSPTFEGGAENTITFKSPTGRYQLWSSKTPIPWKLIIGPNNNGEVTLQYGQSLGSDGKYSTEVNEWSGPVELKANLILAGNSVDGNGGRAGSFTGKITDDGNARTIRLWSAQPKTRFEEDVTLKGGGHLWVDNGSVELSAGKVVWFAKSASRTYVGYPDSSNSSGNPAKLTVKGTLATPVKPNSGDALTAQLVVGNPGDTPAVLEIMDGAKVTNNILVATKPNNRGVVHQFGGDVFSLGWGNGNDGYTVAVQGLGFYGLYGGSYSNRYYTSLIGRAGSRGVFQQTGGAANFCEGNEDTYKEASVIICRGGEGEYLMRGGTVRGNGRIALGEHVWASGNKWVDTPGGYGAFTMLGDGNPTVDYKGVFDLCDRTNGFYTVLNLNAGTFAVKRLVKQANNRLSYINFNGGTFRFRTDSSASIINTGTALSDITIFGKGATFDVPSGMNCWLSNLTSSKDAVTVIRSAPGNGLKSVRIPANMPRTGYSGIMPCKVIGGGGTCAMAALDYDPATGTIAEELLVTCPGWNYAEAPKIIAYGPNFTNAYECVVELTENGQDPGVIYKVGEGQFAINASEHNDFTGTYVISNGILKINANARMRVESSVFVAGGKFWYDWANRTIKSLGGWGGFYGYKCDNETHVLTVTDSLVFDVSDVQEGRLLEMESDIGYEQGKSAPQLVDKDYLHLGDGCKVRLLHPELLPENKASYTLLKVNVPLNRVPELEGKEAFGDGRWRVYLTNGGKTLKLGHSDGSYIFIR